MAVSESREDRRGTLAATSAMHTLLITSPAYAGLLHPALKEGLIALLSGGEDGGGFSELALAELGGVAARTLLASPAAFDASLSSAASELGMQSPIPGFVSAWLAVSDSILLASARRYGLYTRLSLPILYVEWQSSELGMQSPIPGFVSAWLAVSGLILLASARRYGLYTRLSLPILYVEWQLSELEMQSPLPGFVSARLAVSGLILLASARRYEQVLVCLSNGEIVDASRWCTFHCKMANNRLITVASLIVSA